jgi:class 3 adenylate cyclase/predicted ATPase
MASDIGRWLQALGLERYEEVLAENEIDLDALPYVTDDDLKEIGVALGARRKLLAALARPGFADERRSGLEVVVPRGAGAEAERRQLTVMFCDLAGSTALSERLDPEDLREVLRAYQKTCSAIVSRYDGHIAKYIGDGLLVYFGYPQAHEDDAQRAVRAGLEIVAHVAGLSGRFDKVPDLSLAAHLGIHTGLVVAGEMGAGHTREEMAIVGETPNLAARLEALAEPGTVLISDSTLALTEGLFVCEALGAQSLKGISKPVGVYRVVGETKARSRFEAAASRGLLPMVGRGQEMALLLDRWEQAKDGEGQVVLLSGEAGIGKSRIVRMLRDRVAAEDHVRLRYQCSPYHTNSALHPIIDQLERVAGIGRADPPDTKLGKLQALLAPSSSEPDVAVPLVAALLSVPVGDRFVLPQLSPEQQKERTLAALIDQTESLAAQRPLLITFEDAHWIDPTSKELLDLMVDQVQAIRALVVITHRPVFEAPWGGRPHVTSLTLNRLGRRQSRTMVGALTADKPLPEEVMDQILAKTDGVPLFVEELTRTVLEAGLLKEESDRYVLAGPLPPLAIPATLHDSLIARLDRLPAIKEVAQTAAAIGREFSYRLLSEVSGTTAEALEDALGQLARAELVFRRGTPPQATYTFKHALVRDAAYESLLKSKRQELHRRIAEALERSFPERAEAEPELLAYHLCEAGSTEEAISYYRKAGERAAQRSANVEAMTHFERALDLLAMLPDSRKRDDAELDLRINLGPVLMAAKGYAAPQVDTCYTRARELAEKLGDAGRRFTVLYGFWQSRNISGRVSVAKQIADELVHLTERDIDTGRQLQAHHANWTSALCIGDLEGACAHTAAGIAVYDETRHRDHKFLYGAHDPAVCALGVKSVASWLSGRFEEVKPSMAESLALAEQLDHPTTSAVAHLFASVACYLAEDFERAIEVGDAGVALCEESGLLTWRQMIGVVRARARTDTDCSDEIMELQRCIQAYRAGGHGIFWSWFMLLSAEAYWQAGDLDRAAADLERARAHSLENGESWFDAELQRLEGELILGRAAEDVAAAAAKFHKAKKIAAAQNAKSLELRAATSLARLWRDQGRIAEARSELAPVYDWFTEGFDTPGLVEARDLLDAVR